MSGRGFGKALAVVAIAAALTGTLSVGSGAAQDHSVRIEGRVAWIAAETMVVAPYTNSAAVKVDLTQVDQDEYVGLATDAAATRETTYREEER
jgi:hypothetical protein